MAWSGIAKVGSMNRVAGVASDKGEDRTARVPTSSRPGPDNPMGCARDVSLFGRQGHAVPDSRHNQPEYIGASISSAASG